MEFPQANAGNKSAGFGNVARNDGFNYLEPGIHTVAITDIRFEQPATAKPYIAVEFKNQEGSVTTQKLYVSPKAVEITLENLVHLLNKVVSDEELNKLTWPDGDWDAMAAAVKAMNPSGTALQIKLVGEEYNGTIYAKLGYKPFAQKIGEDRLIFNIDKDIKREETANLTSNLQAPSAVPAGGAPLVPGSAPSAPPSAPLMAQ